MLAKLKKKYIGSPAFYRRYVFLALPMIIQNAITNFVSFLDNIMVGQLGTEQMSGVAIINQLYFVFSLTIFGVCSAGEIFGSQFFGKGDHKGHMYTFRFKIYATVLVAVVAIILFITNGSSLIQLYLTNTSDIAARQATLKYALDYLKIVMIGLIPFAVNTAYGTNIKETSQTFIPMLAGIIAVFTNAIFDYLLIFGIGFIPALGVEGAAIATVISRFVECGVVIIWAHSHKASNKYLEGAYFGIGLPKNILKDIMTKGFPLMINEILWASGMTTLLQCYSIRGLDVIAAFNISSTIANLFNIVFIQLGACISIIVGQHLGAGEFDEAKDSDNKMIAFSVFCCVIMAILMLFTGHLFPNIYNTSDDIKKMATQFIYIAAFWMPVCSFSHCTYFTIRSGGKTLITFLFDSFFTWLIVVPIAYCLANFTRLDIVAIYFIVQGTEIIKATIGYCLIKTNFWINKIV